MSLALYALLLRLALPFVALRQWWRHRGEVGRHADWREFFGRYSDRSLRGVIWLHAASTRGSRAVWVLARALGAQYPGHEILVTSGTSAGREALRRICGDRLLSAYLPYDLPGPSRRFLEHFRPRVGVLVGFEIRPALLEACRLQGVPIMLANAHLSRQLARGYARFGSLTRPALASLAASCARDRATVQRLRLLGAQSVAVSGDLNFDAASDPADIEAGRALMAALRGRKALLLAGTCEGEEQMLLDALAHDDGTLIIVVPRDPDRSDAVAALAAERGMSVARRSRGEAPHVGRRVFLGDTAGEMPFYYAVSSVAVLGGSFAPRGGHDLIEACAAGVPAVIGPQLTGFDDATQAALAAGAALRVADAEEAVRIARKLLDARELREPMTLAGLRLTAPHQGATARHLELFRRLLPEPRARDH